MGFFVEGTWHEDTEANRHERGRFVRKPSVFRNWITEDGSAGPSGEGGFPAASGRYHLYVAHACPWAYRATLFRKLKKLEGAISITIAAPLYGARTWRFTDEPGSLPDTVNGVKELWEVYLLANPKYSGRVTVPTLWDKERRTIVNNESSEIIRMLNSAFNRFTDDRTDYYPAAMREEIDRVNDLVYTTVNNGVYRTGFAVTQDAYEEACRALFDTLDKLDVRLSRQRWLVGNQITEADWRLFSTLIRFDAVYHYHFKCNLKRISDYPNLSNYVRDLYQQPGVAETVNMDHIKRHYYGSQKRVNPTGIVPLGPTGLAVDFMAPHDRGRFN
ncbi:MAG: glutathione S-transferase family protein [Xanthobacteraceae bacterium]|nr:glutathione S-transferase family protein [Xanthobacteraceae bacterium]